MTTSGLFDNSEISDNYVRFRPEYPAKLYSRILRYLGRQLPGPYTQAVDVGCGSGQFSRGLTPHFHTVLATDISPEQINRAIEINDHPRTVYRVGSFEHLPLPDKSADLVTSFQAAHWFEPKENFFTEARRVLKPGGCLAVGGYGNPKISYDDGADDAKLQNCFDTFYSTIEKYSLPGNHQVVSHYKDWSLPFTDIERYDDISIEKSMSLSEFVGYLQSFSFYCTYRDKHSDKPDPAEEYTNSHLILCGDSDEE